MPFDTLGLSPKVLAAVADSGYAEPTPIQAQAIPHVLARRDVLGIAQTGTGKTASFVLPMLTRLEQGRARARMPRTLILEPTRELAAQVEENFLRYGKNHRLTVALIIGGVSFDDQLKKLDRGADVLIATPGRLLDIFERGKLLLTGVEILVIDEADRMLDMGFIPDIERITKLIPFTRQTLLFSATMPPEIQHLADAFMSHPERVEVSRPASVVKTVTQLWAKADREPAAKRAMLRQLLRGETELTNAIIFCNRKRDVAILARSLQQHGFDAGALHGDMDQRARTAMLDSFRQHKLTLLIASDVAARGLDIPAVSHVVNFDVPSHAEDYVHRIGRTGRAGRSGKSITIVTPLDSKHVISIEKLTGEKATYVAPPPPAVDEIRDEQEGDGHSRHTEAPRSEAKPRGRRDESRPGRRPERERRPPAPATTVAAPVAAAAAPAAAPAPVARPPQRPESEPYPQRHQPRPAQGESRGRGDRRDRGRTEDDRPVVGLGDHVPQFLLRPVRLPS